MSEPNPDPFARGTDPWDQNPESDPNLDLLARGTDPWDPNPESYPNPDPLGRGTDPQIWIRTKMSRIRNTA